MPARRFTAVALGVTAVVVMFTVIVISPVLLLRLFGDEDDWIAMANIGQAYGGISAILSAAGFLGIAVSVRLQHRHAALVTLCDARQGHIELMRMSLDDPALPTAVDPDLAASPHCREILYANLAMNSWFVNWKTKEMTDSQIRHYATRMFNSEIAREWWASHRLTWGVGLRDRDLAFVELITAVWLHAHPHRRPAIPGQRRPPFDEQRSHPLRARPSRKTRRRIGRSARRSKPTRSAH